MFNEFNKKKGEEEEPAEGEEEGANLPVEEKDLVFRSNESEEILENQLRIYNTRTLKSIEEFSKHMTPNEHIRIAPAGYSAEEIVDLVYVKLGNEVNPLMPIAKKLDGGSEKDLLT
jgi:hypothetical protein